MYKNIKILLPIFLAIALAAGIYLGINLNSRTKPVATQSTGIFQPDKLSILLRLIDRDYVDTIDKIEIIEKVIPEILHELDPHSTYIPASEMKAVTEDMRGNFSGIGVQFTMQNDTLLIIDVISGGPSKTLGILAGDRIIQVNGQNIAGENLRNDSIVSMLRGRKGTMVNVSILRRGFTDLLSFDIKRDDIPIYSIDVSYMITDEIGLIKVNRFSETTYREFVQAINKLKELDAQKLIIDLRGNSGGSLQAVIQMADEFLPANRLIVYTEGKARARNNYRSSANGRWIENDVVVLIDEFSASASEIFAGAIQDNDRGLVIGRRSFGKGLVQEQIPFFDGSALRLTVARFYTPSGRSIQKPYDNGIAEYAMDYYNRIMHNELSEKDSIYLNVELQFQTLNGRMVYGGGGIMPDVFVPLDTMDITPYLSAIAARNLVYFFALKYSDNNRAELNSNDSHSELEAYLDKINILNSFTEYAKNEGVALNLTEYKKSEHIIRTQLYAYIGRNILGDMGFYPIIFKTDNTIIKAMEMLENKLSPDEIVKLTENR